MSNCIIAQSGGPTAVINGTVAGIVKANQMNPIYDIVYGGLYGIEGILEEKLVDLTHMSEEENRILRQTPASVLGSCRFKLEHNEANFNRVFEVMEKYDVETIFYIGGNDSMETVYSLSEYAKKHNIKGRRFIGCPKTIDNDLEVIDHCPGFPSAAKFIATTALQTWTDLNVYTRREVFILETMGRDAGWLTASAALSGIVDLIVLPEVVFDEEAFLNSVREFMSKKNKCYIVVSEGVRYADGSYLAAAGTDKDDFGHIKLGGAARVLREKILQSGISNRCKMLDLSEAQRCHVSEQSLIDVEESFRCGLTAHMRSANKEFTGEMIAFRRVPGDKYDVEYFSVPSSEVAKKVKGFPKEWIKPDYMGITEEGLNYLRPLIQGSPTIITKDGLPLFATPYHSR